MSGEVAAAMAEGVRRVTGSDYAVSTTGLAGPDGDAFNPVGTVWIGGTMPRDKFESASGLSENEIMPCVSPRSIF